VVAPGEVVAGPWDAVVIADVLYLLDPDKRAALLAAYAAELAPEGSIVVKEVDDRPRWKFAVMAAQEKLSTGVLGITAGEDLAFPSLDELAAVLTDLGLEVRTRRLDRGYPWPHVLAVGTTPRAGHA
jgi:2-polyprenyl-6-hydroxyphenyl methylase/3-demethylubiquinone-9 3-methyltransferase